MEISIYEAEYHTNYNIPINQNNYLLIQETTHPVENKGIYLIHSIYVNNNFIND